MQTVAIESLEDPRVAAFRDLRDVDARDRDGLCIVEGRDNVRRLLEQARLRVHSILVTPTALEALRELLEARDLDAPVLLASMETLRGVVGFDLHRGCVALAERGETLSLDALVRQGSPALVLALEHVANPDNIGGLFRNARAFGASGVVLCPRSGDPLYRKAIRTSMGASLLVPFVRCPDWLGGLDRLREAGYRLVALHPSEGGVALGDEAQELRRAERIALLLGSEGQGLGPETLARCDVRIAIPMAPAVDSLNVATASGIALHHFSRLSPA